MTITTKIEECGISVEFENDHFTITNTYNMEPSGSDKINLKIGDLKILEKIFEQYHKMKDIK
jgi:hypothetical protein